MSETERIPAARRREQILAAASEVFGERGYHGATTDQVAQVAGISQPYVVRMFGTKEKLFVEVLGRALDRLLGAFLSVIDDPELDPDEISPSLGRAYVALIEERGVLLCLMHGFALGHDPVIGPKMRDGFMQIYRLLRDGAGMGASAAVDFLAHGMLFNTVLGLRMADAVAGDADVDELLRTTFRGKYDEIVGGVAE